MKRDGGRKQMRERIVTDVENVAKRRRGEKCIKGEGERQYKCMQSKLKFEAGPLERMKTAEGEEENKRMGGKDIERIKEREKKNPVTERKKWGGWKSVGQRGEVD